MNTESVVHGGTDAQGVPAHDFSTNRNSCGPCPQVVLELSAAHVAQYPDPAYTQVCAVLAAFHGVAPARVVIAGSASEFIHRITMYAARQGAQLVSWPPHHYGDYAQAAHNWGLRSVERNLHAPGLHWACEPSSPLGVPDGIWAQWASTPCPPGAWRVADCAYAVLRLDGTDAGFAACADEVWQMWTPNKALGLTGIRAAYAIAPASAPAAQVQALRALAPSWVVGAHGERMLLAWPRADVQQWLHTSLQQLAQWKAQQVALCQALGWQVLPGHLANYFVAQWPPHIAGEGMGLRLAALRAQGIKLRDCTSFGLPGHVRLGVLPPHSQAALRQAWRSLDRG